MKTIIKTICCSLILAVSAAATRYTVKLGGGGNYNTIQACASAMSAGDTCTVYAGTYKEDVVVSAGSVGSYKTLTVNPGDTVYVLSFTINSHVKINGFHIQNPSSPTNAPCVSVVANTTDYYITNNNMYACGPYMIKEPGTGSNVSHGFIQNNKLSYSCSTSSAPNVCTAMAVQGDYNLIENNDISHVSDGPYIEGAHNVLRKNTFHDTYDSDCGSNSGNCHVDFFQADANVAGGGLPAQYLLIEGNTINNMVGSEMHAMGLFQAEACNGQCFNGIVRFNVASHFGAGAILDDNSFATPPPQAWINVKSYNNSWIDGNNYSGNQLYGGTNGFSHGSTGGAEINDLFYYPEESLTDFNPYLAQDTALASFVARNNLGYCTGSRCKLRPKTYGKGSFTDDPGNQIADPKFVNYAGNNFTLLAGSPALAAGTYLTTVASSDSRSGTSLVVNDAGFFQDGSGIPGVNADCIAVTTVANHVCITAVNYQTNTLKLASSITRSVGDPVWLYSDSTGRTVLVGSAPNIGASFVAGSTPAPVAGSTPAPVAGSTPAHPTNLKAVVQ
jgi:hypothetical protein